MAFERKILDRISHVEKRLDYIIGYIEESKLSADDRQAIRLAMKEGKEGRLLGKKDVFS